MIQLLNAGTVWSNPISRDFERFNFSTAYLIELTEYNKEKVTACVNAALQDFNLAKRKYNQMKGLA